MDDLIAFLNARLDEDEWIAQGAARTDDGHEGHWLPVHFGAGGFDARADDHIARHDPARVLREVEADRKLLALLEQDVTDGRERDYEATEMLEQVARIRAAVYSDHPDYRPEWKP